MTTKKEKWVIVRANEAGVIFGKLIERKSNEITLHHARKFHYWEGACAVEQIAMDGIAKGSENNCRITMTVDEVVILNPCQILTCTEKAISNIQSLPEWKKK